MPHATIKSVLLDRDGTVIEERHYLHDPGDMALVSGAGPALARLEAAGMALFLVTNQSGIGRGYYTAHDFEAVQRRVLAELAASGVHIRDTAFCPHAPDAGCTCRKPAIGQFTTLRDRYGLAAATTAVIGDAVSDIAFGLALGSPLTVLVRTGHGAASAATLDLPTLTAPAMRLAPRRPDWPHVLARDLPAAVAWLLRGGWGK